MISKLPAWFWYCAWILAFIAGFVNVIGLISFSHQTVSHLTGNTSLLAASLAALDYRAALQCAMVIASFFAGTIFSGFVIQDSALRLGHRYGITMLVESFFLCIAVPLLKQESLYGIDCLACACGLQNAMVTTYSGTVVRTTHVSGMFTDLGIFLGHALRGLPVDSKRIQMCFLVIFGFFSGGVAGALLFRAFNCLALLIPAGFTASASIAYELFRLQRNKGR
jgi:uncharacterized membrane protein YoaK (UPF0700 family)